MSTATFNPARALEGIVALLTCAVLVLLMAAGHAEAVPVDPTQRLELRQPDGSSFPARPFGDEWYHGFETPAGYTVVRDRRTGTWEYAERKGDHLEPSGLEPGDDSPAGLEPHLRDPSRSGTPPGALDGPDRAPSPANVGTHRSLVILVQFADQRSLGTTPAQWSSRFFGPSDSVRDYYDEVSYGKLDILPAAEEHGTANDGVVGWVTLPSNHPRGDGTLHRATVRDAIAAAGPYVDFDSFDTDGSGSITPDELHVTVIPAGWEASLNCGTPAVWGHQWVTGGLTPTVDGVQVGSGGYTMFGEQHCDNRSPARMATLGIIVHEMGHDLDLPDLYDVDGSSNATDVGGVGVWSVMAAGSWLALPASDAGSHPPHMDAFSKAYQGWIEPRQVSGNAPGTALAQAGANPSAVQVLDNPGGVEWRFQTAPGTGEYFLLENRQRVGYDRALPGCGVLIWHIDETRSAITPNADDARRLVQLEEANANRRPFEAGDAFLGGAAFTDTSNPNSGLYDGTSSGVSATNFSPACAPSMSVDLSVGALEPGPANDAFGSATEIGGLPFAQTIDTRSATVEEGEPAPSCARIGKTAWFRFTPTQDVRLKADTAGSGFDTVLAVHRGTGLGSLAETACSDDVDIAAGDLRSSVEFDALAGETYHFQVGGFRSSTGAVAAGSLNFRLAQVATAGGDGGGGDGGGTGGGREGTGGGHDGGDQNPPDACASRPAPAPAQLGRPRSVRVSKHGRVLYRFGAAAGLDGTITMRSGKALRAGGDFAVPPSGKVTVKLSLSRRAKRALRTQRRMTVHVTVELADACGRTSMATGRITLTR
jgi:M6 family metalloprotease-like protein